MAPSLLKEKEQGVRLYYAQRMMPWPLKDRDVISMIHITHRTLSSIKIEIKASPNELDYKNGTIRIEQMSGFWLLEKFEDQIKITQQLHLEPKGNIPPFILNALLTRGPYTTFSDLRDKLHLK